jgi:hypothetical protein
LQLADALISAGKPFDLQLYPGKTHAIEGVAARTDLYRRIVEHFERWLAPPATTPTSATAARVGDPGFPPQQVTNGFAGDPGFHPNKPNRLVGGPGGTFFSRWSGSE